MIEPTAARPAAPKPMTKKSVRGEAKSDALEDRNLGDVLSPAYKALGAPSGPHPLTRRSAGKPKDAVRAYHGLYPPPNPLDARLTPPSADVRSPHPHPMAGPLKRKPTRRPGPSPRPRTMKLPEAEKWAKVIAAASVDVVCSRRDPRSLKRWLTPAAFERLQHQQATNPTVKGSAARPVNARLFKVNERTVEFAVTVWDQGKLRAVAGRLEKLRHRWLTTALTVG